MDNPWLKVENIMAKREIANLSIFFFCHYVFKKLSAAEASECVYMRESVKDNIDLISYLSKVHLIATIELCRYFR